MADHVHSKYKIFGGFGLILGLNLLIGFGVYKLLTASKISVDKVDLVNDNGARIAYVILFGVLFLFLILLMTQCKRIIADKDGITFINPLLPFLRKRSNWTDFDYFITVDEDSKYSKHEAIWFIKNEKINKRISSFYYSNYFDLLSQVKSKGKGKQYFDPFSQLFALLRLKKIRE
ncbi:hypothetical protein FC093_21700 [Ilyomonas limi]|uniref:Uncharacterized protein n=1 Tax=Ilyomonas limi TaxID=2575867 RepID=A0A4U3KRF2_9BACT|nr:hypothetical protein [Ilyomonas limi]TKK64870.1 hypothetical protein FC093_21700 [Ilyomonas limi]